MEIYNNFLSEKECKEYINCGEYLSTMEQIPFTYGDIKIPGKLTFKEVRQKQSEMNHEQRRIYNESLPDYCMFDSEEIASKIWLKLKKYTKIPLAYGISKRINILRYHEGYKMDVHTDGRFTFLIYLNTIKPEHGGQTCFLEPFEEIRPQCGKAVGISDYRKHYVKKLLKGTRYVMVLNVLVGNG